MHELSSVRSIVEELSERKPKRARLLLGKMISEKDRFEDAFTEIASGTPAASVDLEIVEIPVRAACSCGFRGEVDVPGHVHFVRCPKCGKVADVLSGNELRVEVLD